MHELTTNIDIIANNNWKIFIKHRWIENFSLFLNDNKIDLHRYLVISVSIHNVQLRHCIHNLSLFSLSSLTRINQKHHTWRISYSSWPLKSRNFKSKHIANSTSSQRYHDNFLPFKLATHSSFLIIPTIVIIITSIICERLFCFHFAISIFYWRIRWLYHIVLVQMK